MATRPRPFSIAQEEEILENFHLRAEEQNLFFVDFETDMAYNFYLVGVSDGEKLVQTVLDPELSGFALANSLELQQPVVNVVNILETIKFKNGFFVAYSEAEKKALLCVNESRSLANYSEIPYLNLRKAARKWIRRHHEDHFERLGPFKKTANRYDAKRQKYSLASVMRLTDYTAPHKYAPGKTTSRFRDVIKGLRFRNQNYDELTRTQKGKGTNILKHNRFDVEAMRILMKIIIEEDVSCFKKCFTKLIE